MESQNKFDFAEMLKMGFYVGVGLLFLALVGMISSFTNRDIIYKTVSLSFVLILVTNFAMGYLAAKRTAHNKATIAIIAGIIVGVVGTGMLAILILLVEPMNLRAMFVNASPDLVKAVTFGNESMTQGLITLIGLGTFGSVLGAVIDILPERIRKILLASLVTVIVIGTLEELVSDVITNIFKLLGNKKAAKPILKLFFGRSGLLPIGAVYTFVITAIIVFLRTMREKGTGKKISDLPPKTQTGVKVVIVVVGLVLVIILPKILGGYLSEILVTVAIYTLMGFGLNIVVGFAGLLDLGYVAFFAIGAYTMAVLTSTQLFQTTELGSVGMSFWAALPFSIGMAVLWGVMLGIPVLRMRGDYLAIVTLGFGEIIRVLALSNFLQPKIGGAQGILGIPKPIFFGIELKGPQELYYLVIVAAALAAFISWRMRDSRAGRSWMAMREDEDVAEAMGINLVKTKLLAFATGAGLSGLAGAIFAAKLGSIYPHSFNLLISINVLSLIIVGGVGSLPGVLVGSFVLVGLPELLREFSEYRMLIFGALLVTMMLVKPEGFIPAATQKRELSREDEEPVLDEITPETA